MVTINGNKITEDQSTVYGMAYEMGFIKDRLITFKAKEKFMEMGIPEEDLENLMEALDRVRFPIMNLEWMDETKRN